MADDTLTLTLDTGNGAGGDVVIRLRSDLAPGHVARITELAGEGFYDGVVFHRVIDEIGRASCRERVCYAV